MLPSARKHGIPKLDAQHAYRNPIDIHELSDDMTMYIGPGRDGTLLEVGVVVARDEPGRVFIAHAMKARARYLPQQPQRKPRKR